MTSSNPVMLRSFPRRLCWGHNTSSGGNAGINQATGPIRDGVGPDQCRSTKRPQKKLVTMAS